MTRIRKIVLWVCGLAAVALVYNLDAIVGQWKFDRLCKNEGGSKFYAQVEKDVGWEVESEDDHGYQVPFNIGHVAFVRYRDRQGNLLDVHLKPGPTPWSKGYDITPANPTKQIRYRLTMEQDKLPEDERMSRTQDTITDVQRGAPVASHTRFSYRWTKPERMILSMPTGATCHAGHEGDQFFAAIFEPRTNK